MTSTETDTFTPIIFFLQAYHSAVSLPLLLLFQFPPTQVKPEEDCVCVCCWSRASYLFASVCNTSRSLHTCIGVHLCLCACVSMASKTQKRGRLTEQYPNPSLPLEEQAKVGQATYLCIHICMACICAEACVSNLNTVQPGMKWSSLVNMIQYYIAVLCSLIIV